VHATHPLYQDYDGPAHLFVANELSRTDSTDLWVTWLYQWTHGPVLRSLHQFSVPIAVLVLFLGFWLLLWRWANLFNFVRHLFHRLRTSVHHYRLGRHFSDLGDSFCHSSRG
jgi:hypothetical protein